MCVSLYDVLFNISGIVGMFGADKRRLGTDVDMQRAYHAVMTNKLSINQAARDYSVSRMTLSNRVNDRISLNAKLGHDTALNPLEEQSLARYIAYMYRQRFPITRMQVMGLAWAIDLKKEEGKRLFTQDGPTFKWWRGFKRRYPSLTLRVAETVDKGRINNATPEVINNYFTKMQEIFEENYLSPHRIYNCDEVAILLNKHGQKVVVPRNAKHVHTLGQGHQNIYRHSVQYEQMEDSFRHRSHSTKACPVCVGLKKTGPINAGYATTDSGFITQEMYASWLVKVFIPNIPPLRPVLLIQDNATAHVSSDLIAAAIQNNIILLCLPSKLTHILQPCDVGVIKKMRTKISKTMNQLQMTRGDAWVSKGRYKAVFKTIHENTMQPASIPKMRHCTN